MYLMITASIILQLAAAVLALCLIPLTGRRWSWILISLGLAGMVVRRAHVLILMHRGLDEPNLMFELIGLAISAAVFLGIAQIRPMFRQLKEFNKKLTESEERFRTVADFVHDWEYWRGPDGAFIYMSPSCVQVTGYSHSEFMADPELMERILHPEDREAVAAHMAVETDERGMGDLDFRIITADGSTHWIGHRCLPMIDGQGQYLGVRVSNRNIDNRKWAEAEAASRMKSELLTLISHELKTPLTSILGFAKHANKQFKRDVLPAMTCQDDKCSHSASRMAESLSILVLESERLFHLIQDVIDLTTLVGEIESFTLEPFPVRDIVDRAASQTRSFFEQKKLSFSTQVPKGLPPVLCDPERIVQALVRLLENAAKFTTQGSVTLSAERCGQMIKLCVADTGPGLPPEDRELIFAPFRQLGDQLVEKPEGFGLGLAICKEITEHHGGEIGVESELGMGSRFWITLKTK